MTDVAPELAKRINDLIAEAETADQAISAIYDLIASGGATYEQAYELAEHIGGHISAALQDVLTADALPGGKLYYNIADRTVRPALEAGYERITTAAADIQTGLNEAAGFGLKGVAPKLPDGRIHSIVQAFADAETPEAVARLADEPVKNLSISAVDKTIQENVELHARAGLNPRIIRIAESGCCKWCASLAGTYEYPAPKDVYRRHDRCRCVVEYDPRNGGRRQNVWTKRWTDPDADAKIEARKQYGTETFIQSFVEEPKRLANYTPGGLKEALEEQGYKVTPLTGGQLNGVSFEAGGGYKVNFSDGGLLMYHPAARSHHDGAYYKISTGKGGTHHYGIDGQEKQIH